MPPSPNKLSQFWQELKRRNVVRVITVYTGAAFIILSLVDMIREPFELPNWSFKLVVVILSVGMIIAIILSWIYDIHPDGGMVKTEPANKIKPEEPLRSSKGWMIATYISLAIILGLIALNIFGSKSKTTVDESLEKSIAVLPFHNLSGDYDKEYVCDGLTDEIINHLYKIQSFDKVVSLTSVLNYKNSDKNATEIADELKVNYILAGTFKEIGKQVRITTQLIEAGSDNFIWQHDYNQSYEDIIAIQSDIALQLAAHLKAFLTDPEKQYFQKTPTFNQQAYDKYLLGKHYYRQGHTRSNMYTAIRLFNESVEMDPEFALAHTYLAMSYLTVYWMHYDRNQKLLNKSREAIDVAYRIDPELPEVYIAQAEYYYHGLLDYPNALDQLEKATQFMPDHPDCRFLTAAVYRRMGDWERATIEFEKAHEFDPGSIRNIQDLALTYYLTGKYEDAMKLLNSEIMRSPDIPGLYVQKIVCSLMRDGSTRQARKVLQDAAKLNISEISLMSLPFCFTHLLDIYDGNYQNAMELIASGNWDGYNSLNWYHPKSIFKAMIFGLMGLPEEAYAYFDSTRITLENKLQEFPEDPRILSSLGIAYAGLGEKEKAMNYGNEAVKKCSLQMDALRGTFRIHDLAWMYVTVQEYDAALEQLGILLSNPGPFTAPLMKLDPKWKPLWDHPDFIRLTE